ncbi:LysR family transcriptional regulator [Roseomonas marmotae]|uniref:LysR family transcriptional regulator n=1 Tax=Roseomonas marmotae TaxID=2768161 RepID=A0ABS3KIN3_9PROT|nr:LysR family transcriptional regulator [Roseomonas marmotae]MBO1076877.1 LysR family transcriptional regulator [Roseomonas marmotae]QTI81127.1 LysR family transcriptional regulator [Roseomonas marmotae]
MELKQLRCFLAVADELHFGRAAVRLNMLPTALGRQVRLLEEELGTALLRRTTRQVTLTVAGAALAAEARAILEHAAAASRMVRGLAQMPDETLRIGAIDSAAAGLLPELLARFRALHPRIEIRLVEAKSVEILPQLRGGRLDLGFIRPPAAPEPGLAFRLLLQEHPVAVLPRRHPLAGRRRLHLAELAGLPLILPPRHARPHSHDGVMRLFASLGLSPRVVQEAEEKQTIVNLVAAGIGIAMLPEWAARMRVPGVVFRPLELPEGTTLPEWGLGMAWYGHAACAARDLFLAMLEQDGTA